MKQLTLVSHMSHTAESLHNSLQKHVRIHDIAQRDNALHVFDVACDDEAALTPELRELLYSLQCDFALQDADRVAKKIFISDMDATMVVGETIDEMADELGLAEQVSDITERAMRGEIGFEQALTQRLALMKGLDKGVILDLAERVKLAKGSEKLLAHINTLGIESCLVSGGFSEFTSTVSQRLGFDHHKGNQLSYDAKEKLAGGWDGELVDAHTKLATLQQLAQRNNVSADACIAIGDGANDSLMVSAAGLGVAYYGKPALREVANAEIHCGDLISLMYFI